MCVMVYEWLTICQFQTHPVRLLMGIILQYTRENHNEYDTSVIFFR